MEVAFYLGLGPVGSKSYTSLQFMGLNYYTHNFLYSWAVEFCGSSGLKCWGLNSAQSRTDKETVSCWAQLVKRKSSSVWNLIFLSNTWEYGRKLIWNTESFHSPVADRVQPGDVSALCGTQKGPSEDRGPAACSGWGGGRVGLLGPLGSVDSVLALLWRRGNGTDQALLTTVLL